MFRKAGSFRDAGSIGAERVVELRSFKGDIFKEISADSWDRRGTRGLVRISVDLEGVDEVITELVKRDSVMISQAVQHDEIRVGKITSLKSLKLRIVVDSGSKDLGIAERVDQIVELVSVAKVIGLGDLEILVDALRMIEDLLFNSSVLLEFVLDVQDDKITGFIEFLHDVVLDLVKIAFDIRD
jgi:hypothetical protein